MGGCIAACLYPLVGTSVSSLHGRVYRAFTLPDSSSLCFLPTWEGVSGHTKPLSRQKKRFLPTWEGVSNLDEVLEKTELFPPYMGGCIGHTHQFFIKILGFLPTWEGVSPIGVLLRPRSRVSSLHGRVYR